MNRENYQKAKEIFHAALERPPAEREQFLAETCADDQILLQAVKTLLANYQTDFLEHGAVAEVAESFSDVSLLAIGQTIGRYEIRDKLGAGGMGEVFLAHDKELKRLAAIKVLHIDIAKDKERVRRFLQEARAASSLNHPNILTIYEIGESEGKRFIASEYIAGETLRKRLKRDPLSVEESVEIAIQIAAALNAAHMAGIIHRDIKPENVILREDKLVKVLDFGLAKLAETKLDFLNTEASTFAQVQTTPGLIMGTMAYMSPEQARGLAVDHRSDIWSLGVTLYEMLTGKQPFGGETTSDIIVAILTNEPASISDFNSQIPVELEQLVGKALRKDSEERYQTANELLIDLRQVKKRLEFAAEVKHSVSPNKSGEVEVEKIRVETLDSTQEMFLAGSIKEKTSTNTNIQTNNLNSCIISPNETQRKFPSKSSRWILAAILGVLIISVITSFVWKPSHPNNSPFAPQSINDLKISPLLSALGNHSRAINKGDFSPNGNFIVFYQQEDEKSAIYVKQVSGGEAIKITDGKSADRTPVWSSDEQRLAFLSDRDNVLAIWTVPSLGGTPVLLKILEVPNGKTVELKKWSKDQRTIYFANVTKLFTLNLNSGQITQISSSTPDVIIHDFSISPQEDKFAYTGGAGNEKLNIYVQSLQGGTPQQITSGEGDKLSPAWFPDGQRIIYTSDQSGNSQIYIIDLEGDKPIQITFADDDCFEPIVSPDGQKIVFSTTREEANINSYNLSKNTETSHTASFGVQLMPNSSPDGNQLLFQASTKAEKLPNSSINIMPLTNNSQLLTLANNGFDAKWSPDGQTITFLRYSDVEENIWKVNVNGGIENQLTKGGIIGNDFTISPFNFHSINYAWSGDGNQVAYFSRKSGADNVWTISKDGLTDTMWTQNTDKNLRFSALSWSPDAKRIAFVARKQNETGKEQYSVRIAEMNQTATIFETDSVTRILDWSADGKEIFIARRDNNDASNEIHIYLLKLFDQNTKPELIARLLSANFYNIKLSPDSKQIALSARSSEKTVNIYLVSTANGEIRKITDNRDPNLFYSGLNWSPESETLYYSKQKTWDNISMITNSERKGEINVQKLQT